MTHHGTDLKKKNNKIQEWCNNDLKIKLTGKTDAIPSIIILILFFQIQGKWQYIVQILK